MTTEEYREEGFRLYETDLNQALDCFQKAAEDKDFLSALALASHFFGFCEDDSIPAMKWYENKQSAIQWINEAEKWFNEAGKPAELNEAMSEGFYMRGILQKSQYPFSALLDFYRAFDMGKRKPYPIMANWCTKVQTRLTDIPKWTRELRFGNTAWSKAMKNVPGFIMSTCLRRRLKTPKQLGLEKATNTKDNSMKLVCPMAVAE